MKNADTVSGRRFFEKCLSDPDNFPVSFVYNGKKYKGLGGLGARKITCGGGDSSKVVITAKLDSSMSVRVEARFIPSYGQSEYTVWFENEGEDVSGVLSDVWGLDMNFEGKDPVLRGCMGDHDNWYSAYEHDLSASDKYFISEGGRATHIVFPYFDLVHGNGGTMLASGWAGTWEALFSSSDRTTRVRMRSNCYLNAALLPGEKVRTALYVFLPYKGRNYFDATNLWRRWFMEHVLPKANAEGDPLKPFSTVWFAPDTGLPNSDGSISERSFTWKPTLDKLKAEDLVADFRWFDAGWYFDPDGNTVPTDWWGTVGSWELDREKWPGNSFLESNEACHKEGMKVLVWFEPERVTNVPALCRNYGYKEEWSIGEGNVRTNDLGNPECLEWTLNRITKMMGENGVDMYREDNNSDPGFAWPHKDGTESEKFGVPRSGMAENNCICGHYALWDGIIEFCRKNGKCTFIDSCASGGGRNDIESMRRAFPLMRSDYDRTTSSMRLSQTVTFCRWIPFHGSCTKEAMGQLDYRGNNFPPYVARASYLPIFNFSGEFSHDENMDFGLMRRNIEEWKSVRHLLTKDFYALTPWRHDTDTDHWTALAYEDPDSGEGILMAFRMEEAEEDTQTFRIPFAVSGHSYRIKDADSGKTDEYDGGVLNKEGITISLPEKKSSALLYIFRSF